MMQSNGRYVDYSFVIPRKPLIRIWGASEVYKNGLYILAVDDSGGCFSFTDGASHRPIVFKKDESGNLTSAVVGDIIVEGLTATKPVEGWIYICEGDPAEPPTPKYTIYVYADGNKAGTKFGTYRGPHKEPALFKEGGENYFVEMTDAEGHWLWLYRLYAPISS